MIADTALYLVLGSIAGGFINGLAGTGMALFALGFYLLVLDPLRAVAVVALMVVLSGLQGLWIVRKEILMFPQRLACFVLPGLLGVPVGISLLTVLNSNALRVLVASVLIVYGGCFGFRSALPTLKSSSR